MSDMHFGSNQQWNNAQFALQAYEPQNDAKSSTCQYISLLMLIFAQQWHSIKPCLHGPRFHPSQEDPGCKQWLILSAQTNLGPCRQGLKGTSSVQYAIWLQTVVEQCTILNLPYGLMSCKTIQKVHHASISAY